MLSEYNDNKKMLEEKVQEILKEINVSEVESAIYILLLKVGPLSISALSGLSKIPRTTVHENVDRLVQKGLVVHTVKGRYKKVVAEDPAKLKVILLDRKVKLETQIHQMESTEGKISDLLELIYTQMPGSSAQKDLSIRYYEGKKGVGIIYQKALKAKEFRAYVNAVELGKAFPENFDLFINELHSRNDMHVWEIMEYSETSVKYARSITSERYHASFIPASTNLPCVDYMIFDGHVAIVDLSEQNPSGTIISGDKYYCSAKKIYDFIWDTLNTLK